MERNWIAIWASAALMIAGSVAVLAAALGGLMQGITPMAPQGRTGGAAPPLDVIGMAISAILAVLSGWGIWTAVAVFRRRGWARAFMLIFASLAALIGAGGGLAILFEPASAHAGHGMDALREVAGALCGGLAAIGVWWLVLFNLKSTKEYFAPNGPGEPGRGR